MAGFFGEGIRPFAGVTTSFYRSISSGYSSFVPPSSTRSLFSLSGYGINTASGDQNTKQSVTELKEYSNQLKDAANQLVAGYPPLMEQMITAMEDREESIELKRDEADSSSRGQSFTVQVRQLAAAQQNEGTAFPQGVQAVQPGSYTLRIGDNRLQIDAEENDEAESLQQKLADALNKAGTGIQAQVENRGGASFLLLTGQDTGASAGFEVADEEGNLAQALGLDNIQTKAQDALYTVNGTEQSSPDNDVTLTRGLEITLRKESGDGAATLSLQADEERITPVVREMAEGFAGLLKSAQKTGGLASELLAGRMDSLLQTSGEALSNAGIEIGGDGELNVDEDRLSAAIQDGSLQKALGAGFASGAARLAESVSRSPLAYAANSAAPAKGGTYGKSLSWETAFTPLAQNTGVLFESVI